MIKALLNILKRRTNLFQHFMVLFKAEVDTKTKEQSNNFKEALKLSTLHINGPFIR